MAREDTEWTLDRHIPIAIILTLLGGMMGGAYYFGGITKDHENRIASLEKVIPEVRGLGKDITEIKTHLPYISKGIEDLQRKVDDNVDDTNDVIKFLKDKIEWIEDKER